MSELEFNKDAAKQFLKVLDPEAKEFTFQCFHPDRTVHPTAPMHGTLDFYWNELCRYNMSGYGVYVTINETDLTGRKIKNIKSIRAVWQEDDGDGKGKKLPFKPSMIVATSPGHYHRYLLIKKVSTKKVPKDKFDKIQKTLVEKYGSDKNARDITRVLRLPGFFNVKPSLAWVCGLWASFDS
jgi:hypothetical protein